jgi:hypothetical protein
VRETYLVLTRLAVAAALFAAPACGAEGSDPTVVTVTVTVTVTVGADSGPSTSLFLPLCGGNDYVRYNEAQALERQYVLDPAEYGNGCWRPTDD